MRRRCNQNDCGAPETFCKELASPNYQDCGYWQEFSTKTSQKAEKSTVKREIIPWTGVAMEPKDIQYLSHRSTPQIVGIIGASYAGKTSYLGMLYTLLFNGKKIKDWNFAGSNTLIAWETQAKSLKVNPNGKVSYPEPTPRSADYYSLYHLALRNSGNLHDILLADSSGEVFTDWSRNTDDPTVQNARWIYQNSTAFIIFISCEDILEKKGASRNNISQLLGQVSANLKDRPVIIVWSKSDLMDELESKYPNIKKAIESSIDQHFPKSESIEISNFSTSENDELCHINNVKVLESILNELNKTKELKLTPDQGNTNDFFFQYKGSHEGK